MEELVVARFFFTWEGDYAKYECVVEGCDHRVGECEEGGAQGGYLYQEAAYWRDAEEGTLKARGGPGCSCCTARLLAS